MLKKIILAGATASVIAVSGLAAMTTGASASPLPPPPPPGHHHKHDCRPVKHYVKWFDRHGHPHWKKVVRIECGPKWKLYH